jgi:PAS domain-containing protein
MSPLIIARFIICGICLAIGLLHLAIFNRMPGRRADLFFALMCFSAATGALFEGLAYQAFTIDIDNQGRIRYVNPYFEKVSGYVAAEAI